MANMWGITISILAGNLKSGLNYLISDLYRKPEKIQETNWKKLRCTEKKIRCAGPEFFLRFEVDLNFSRPWFSEIKVQIKWQGLSGEINSCDILKEFLTVLFDFFFDVVFDIRPFNLHLDFWKSRSWEIKVCFTP